MKYEKLREAAKKFTIFLAYNANIDAIVRINSIKHLFTQEDFKKAKNRNPTKIKTKIDILAGILKEMQEEVGGELQTNEKMSEWMKKYIIPDEKRIGGQIGIMSNFLSNLGFNCLVYFPLLSQEQSEFFERKSNLRFLTSEGWKKLDDYYFNTVTKTNWVFEFKKGESLFGVKAKGTSRFIAASRPDQDRIKSQLIMKKAKEINQRADIAILSGYQDVRKKYSDSDYKEQLKAGKEFLKKLTIPSQLEFAHVADPDIRNRIVRDIAKNVDVLSMDSEEIISMLDALGLYPEGKKDVIWNYKALKIILDELNLKCAKVHTKHYFLSVSRNYLERKNIENAYKIVRNFNYAKCEKGFIKSWDDLELASKVRPSAKGLREKKTLEKYLKNSEDVDVVIVPNKIHPAPKFTVGLGDVISAGSFAIENLLSVIE